MTRRLRAALPALVAISALASACGEAPLPPPAPAAAPAPAPADLVKEDLAIGAGPEAKPGARVAIHYTLRLAATNAVIDTSIAPGRKAFSFTVGGGEAIAGMDQGVAGMKVGGRRKLVVPPRLGYGDAGVPPKVPPASTLVFEIELLEVRDGGR